MKSAVFLALFAVAALFSCAAYAGDFEDAEKKKYRKAEKVIKILSYVDMDMPYVREAAYYLDERIEGGYLNLSQQQIDELGGVKMQIRYDIDGINADNFEMRLYHDDSNFEFNGSPEGAYLSYRIEF